MSFSSNYEGSWDVTNLIGGSDDWYGDLPVWCTASEAPLPHWVVIELPKSTWFTTLVFNNFIPDETDRPGISAKDVEIQVSDMSASEGFKSVAGFELERNKNNQEVRLEPTRGRWLKIIVTSNWGNAEYTELGQLGAFDDGSPPSDIAGELKGKGFVDLYGIYFDFGSANIRRESTPVLEKIAAFMKAHPDSNLVVEGHTDNVGDAKSNQRLSEHRATSVVSSLTTLGVAPGRLTAIGYGDTKPVGDNKIITG